MCLRSFVTTPLIPPNLEVPCDSISGMMSEDDGDSPCLADGHGDDTLIVEPFLLVGFVPFGFA